VTASWLRITKQAQRIAREIEAIGRGDYLEVEIRSCLCSLRDLLFSKSSPVPSALSAVKL
jgi:hypothetical protein